MVELNPYIPSNLKDIGPALRQTAADLNTLYAPMAASETLAAWLAWPLTRGESLWAGMERFKALEMAARGQGARGCPWGARGCSPESVISCDHCSRKAQSRQETML